MNDARCGIGQFRIVLSPQTGVQKYDWDVTIVGQPHISTRASRIPHQNNRPVRPVCVRIASGLSRCNPENGQSGRAFKVAASLRPAVYFLAAFFAGFLAAGFGLQLVLHAGFLAAGFAVFFVVAMSYGSF